jgi:hypothetical protein
VLPRCFVGRRRCWLAPAGGHPEEIRVLPVVELRPLRRHCRNQLKTASKNAAHILIRMDDCAEISPLEPGTLHYEFAVGVASPFVASKIAAADDAVDRDQNVTPRFDYAPEILHPGKLKGRIQMREHGDPVQQIKVLGAVPAMRAS